MTGDIVMDVTAANALANAPDKVEIEKAATFTQAAPAGYVWVASDEEGVQTIAAAVATVTHNDTTTSFASLEAAFAAAADGDTITLLSNCEGNGIVAPQGKFQQNGLTVDFAGYTYAVTGTPVGSTGTETIGFQLLKDNNLTFRNGTITGSSRTNSDLLRIIQNYSNLTLDNMTISLEGQYYNQTTMSNCNGTIVIKDSTINAPDYSWANYTVAQAAESLGAVAFSVGTFASYTGVTVEVTGNSVINGNIKVDPDNAAAANNTLTLTGGTLNGEILMVDNAAEATVTKQDSFNAAAPEDYKWQSNDDGTSTLVPIVYVAEIVRSNETLKFETLEAAFAAAADGDTITLLSNCEGNGIVAPQGKFQQNGLTVDFAGYTYAVTGTPVGSTGTETIGFQLLKDNNLTFRNGTITGSSRTNSDLLRIIQNYSNLTLDNMTISLEGQYYNQTTMSNCNGTIVIKDSTINAPDYSWANYTVAQAAESLGAVAFSVGTFASYTGVTVEVTGNSVINGNIKVDPDNAAAASNKLTLTSGTLNGEILMVDNAAEATVEQQSTFNAAAPEGYRWSEADNNGVQTLEIWHQHVFDYENPTVEWAIIDGSWTAIFTYTCACGAKEESEITPSYTENRGVRTYLAIDSHGNESTNPVTLTYKVTLDGVEQPTLYHWGEICALQADGAKKWTVNGVAFADGVASLVFAVTEDMVITTEAAEQPEAIAAVMVKIESTQAGTASFNAKWTLPEGAKVEKVTIYRGYNAADKDYSAGILVQHGTEFNVDLLVRNGDYTLKLTQLTSETYQYAAIVIEYTVGGEAKILTSSVAKVKVK